MRSSRDGGPSNARCSARASRRPRSAAFDGPRGRYITITVATSPLKSSTFGGAARTAHEIQPSSARVAGGSTAKTSTAVVELVRNVLTICPKPTNAAIARPTAGGDFGA